MGAESEIDIHNEEHDHAKLARRVTDVSNLISEAHDFVDLDYTDGNLTTATFKLGGSGGTTVATVTITYTVDGCIDTVTKS